MPDEKKQADKTDEPTEVETGEPRPRLGTSADVAEVAASYYAKVARPGR
ncbi:hypothetical protein GCM10009623_36340 [Nocardioides aestuarii]|uniref:Uncharacterized protein n=1 Tax=Nocardioides aestuarii TaxID=252231 RepID=A0ABW4TTT9_9ACTN